MGVKGLNQINYLDTVMVHLIYFRLFTMTPWNDGTFFLLNKYLLSNHYLITQKLDSQFML